MAPIVDPIEDLFDRGVTCLGPVTRAGCNSWCVNNGNICYGCRGLVSNPNEKGMLQVLTSHGITLEHVVKKMEMYNRCREEGDDLVTAAVRGTADNPMTRAEVEANVAELRHRHGLGECAHDVRNLPTSHR